MRRLELNGDALAALVSEIVGRGRTLRVEARGRSMGASLPDGSRPVLCAATPRTVRRGDVLLCRVGPRLLLHRARAVSGAGVWLQGDALPRADGWVPWQCVLAKVTVRVPRSERWVQLARSAWRWLCVA